MVKKINNNLLYSFLLFLILIPRYILSDDQVWVKDFEIGLEKAKKEKKPIVVFVTASWCSYCTMMHNNTLTNHEVTESLFWYSRIEIDFDKNPEFRSKWKINSIPVTLLLNQFGEFVAREDGYKEPKAFNKP